MNEVCHFVQIWIKLCSFGCSDSFCRIFEIFSCLGVWFCKLY